MYDKRREKGKCSLRMYEWLRFIERLNVSLYVYKCLTWMREGMKNMRARNDIYSTQCGEKYAKFNKKPWAARQVT